MTTSTKRLLTIFLPILTGLLLVLFWEAITGIPKQHSLWSMDGSPLYNHDFKAQTWRELTGRNWLPHMLGMPGPTRVFQPDDLLKFVFPPLVYHLLSWIGAFLLILGATYYLLTTYGIKGLRAALPAMALGFSGYTFTLISAGHRATPMSMGYAILAMALVRQGIRKNTISHFVAAGLACVYGIINQMDVMGFLLILIAAYGLLQLILHWPVYQKAEVGGQRSEDGGRGAGVRRQNSSLDVSNQLETENQEPRTKNLKPIAKLAMAIVLAAVTFLVVGWPFLSQTFFGAATGRSTLEYRQEQIEQTGGDRWEFITNWSLPPEGALEFIAPSVFGRENVSREVPYWGRLGQSLSWPETGQGFRSFRQHNLYVGGIQIAFAFYALFALFQQGETSFSRKRRMEIIFWLSATGLTLLLALGRYTPLYRIIYHIPVIGNIRAPVKWFHLTEITIVILMAFGLDALLKDLQAIAACQIDHKKNKKDHAPRLPVRFAIGTTCTAVLLLIVSSIAQSTGFGLQSLWAAHGLEPVAPQLRNAMAGSLFHATLVFTALAAILWLLLKKTADRRQQTTDPLQLSGFSIQLSALLVVLAIDLAVAHKPYIHVEDVSAFYAPNPIADIVLEHTPYRMADYLTSRTTHDPIWRNFWMKGVEISTPPATASYIPPLFGSLQKDPLRLWQLTSSRFIIGQSKQLEQLVAHPSISLRARFEISSEGRVVLNSHPKSPFVLLEYTQALPRVQLYHSWQSKDNMIPIDDLLQDPEFTPRRTAWIYGKAPLASSNAGPPSSVIVKQYTKGQYQLELPPEKAGLLVFTDLFTSRRKTSAGEPTMCNAGFYGVFLSEPTEHVSISMNPLPMMTVSLVIHALCLIAVIFQTGFRPHE